MGRMAVLAAVAGCAVAMTSGCAAPAVKSSGPPAAARTGPPPRVRVAASPGTAAVPWVARIAPSPKAPPPVAVPTQTARFAPCAAAQLSGHAGDLGAGAGSQWAFLVVTNRGSAPCTITAGPSGADGILTDGSRRALAISPQSGSGAFGLTGPPVNLRPGQSAEAVISGGDGPGMCPGTRGYDLSAVLLGIGTTGSVRVPFHGTGGIRGETSLLLYSCAPARPFVSGFGTPVPKDTPPPSPLNVLTISRSMPASLVPGSTAGYTVTLTNPTARTVALSPCPAYTQFIIPPHGKPSLPGTFYYLNCAAAPRIPAHGAVTFAMRIQVPLGKGEAKYGWIIPDTTLETGGITTLR